jgi:predicted RNA-binding protein YlqC (UPF0109 family)
MLNSDDYTSRSTTMRELVVRMAQAVVSDPGAVVVEETETENITTFILTVNPDDMGRVIGKQGRVANAMRTLLRVSAGLEGRRVRLEIEPAQTPERDRFGSSAEY